MPIADQTFRTRRNKDEAKYTPETFALISGALREAALVGDFEEAPAIYTRFFKKIGNKMQLSEGAASGEFGFDSDGDGIPFIPQQPDNLPPVFASEAIYEFSDYDEADEDEDEDEGNGHEDKITRLRNFPNPFNPSTTIAFSLTQAQQVSLQVYNIQGRVVANLVNGALTAGEYQFRFDGTNLSSGVYFYRLQAGVNTFVKKINLIK